MTKLCVSPGGAANAGKLSICSRSCAFVAAMPDYDSKHKILEKVSPWLSLNRNLGWGMNLCSGRGNIINNLHLLA